jgi:hypothetical protein
MRHHLLAAATTLWTATVSLAVPVTLVSDSFVDGGRTDGADALDVAWYTSNNTLIAPNPAGLFVSADTLLNPVAPNNGLRLNTASGGVVVAPLASTTTLNPGDQISLSFSFRDLGNATALNGLRVGLWNGGTLIPNNDGSNVAPLVSVSSGINDDRSLAVSITNTGSAAAPTASSVALFRRQTNGGALSGGGTTTDRTFGNTVALASPLGANKTDVVLTYTAGESEVALAVSINGTTVSGLTLAGTSPLGTYGIFNTIGFSQISGGSGVDLRLSDVVVTYTPIPEPATLAGVAGLAGLALRRRRR